MPAAANGKRKAYHHGNLTDALIAATVEIIEERGVEHVSVREAARRAGVSPGAPFRHFASRAALLTAVGEQAMERLALAVREAVDAAAEDGPAAQFAAIGDAYLDWALSNPTHFQIISSREIMDFATPSPIRARNDAIRAEMIVLLEQMQTRGELHAQADLDQLVLAARAHVYGLARMAVDGHLPEWYDREPPRAAMRNALRLFLASILPAPAP